MITRSALETRNIIKKSINVVSLESCTLSTSLVSPCRKTAARLIQLLHGHCHTDAVCYQDAMNSVLLTRVFRRLFSHQTCSRLLSHPPLPYRTSTHSRRGYGWAPEQGIKRDGLDIMWQQRPDVVSLDMMKEFQSFPTVTADALRNRRKRPSKVKMLMRDFIEGKAPHPKPIAKFAN